MKHARTLARSAAISFALLALSNGADALPLNGAWSGVLSSVDPATGIVTRTVSANAAERRMTVRWQCGRPTLCVVTGDQIELMPQTYLLVPPAGTATPQPYFALAQHTGCVARYGSGARVGAWITRGGVAAVTQCFTLTPTLGVAPRGDWPPIRLAPLTLPLDLRDPARDLRSAPQRELPPAGRPGP